MLTAFLFHNPVPIGNSGLLGPVSVSLSGKAGHKHPAGAFLPKAIDLAAASVRVREDLSKYLPNSSRTPCALLYNGDGFPKTR